MQRRLILAQFGLLALAGCGFQLRGAPEFAFATIFVNVPETSPFGNELKRNLASLGNIKVITDPALQATAQAVLELPVEQREKTVVGMNSSGQVTEFQIRLRLHFRLHTSQGKELIPDTELLLQRDISFNESAVLAKEAEEGLMYRDMQSDLVQQLLRRLAAVKSI